MTTQITPISNQAWTEIAAAGSKGLVSNPAGQLAYLYQADSAPSASVKLGHPLRTYESFEIDLSASTEKVYALSNSRDPEADHDLVFTPAV